MNQRGDTLVEVLLATVVLSIIVAGAVTLTNRATRIGQTSFERTDVSNLLREQAELIRANPLQATSIGQITGALPADDTCSEEYLQGGGTTSFYIDSSSGSVDFVPGIKTDGFYRIWVERIDGSTFFDFDINACWEGIGGEVEQVSGMTVRISTGSTAGARP